MLAEISKGQWQQLAQILKFPVSPYKSNFVSLMNYTIDYYLPALDLFISLSTNSASKILDLSGGPRGQLVLQLYTGDTKIVESLNQMIIHKTPLTVPRLRSLLKGHKAQIIPQYQPLKIININWIKGRKIKESDLEAAFLVSPTSFGLKGGWKPIMQQKSLSTHGRIDAVLQNSNGQLLLVEFQHHELTKDHFSKILVYRRQLAKDLNFPLDQIKMLLVANTIHETILECCADVGINTLTVSHKKMELLITQNLKTFLSQGGVTVSLENRSSDSPSMVLKKGRPKISAKKEAKILHTIQQKINPNIASVKEVEEALVFFKNNS